MRNKKGLELAISTLILMILGIAILIGLIIALNYGFQKFREAREPFVNEGVVTELKAACDFACKNDNKIVYCCENFKIDNKNYKCNDERFEIECGIDCRDFECGK